MPSSFHHFFHFSPFLAISRLFSHFLAISRHFHKFLKIPNHFLFPLPPGHERVDTDPNALAIRDDGDDKKTPVDRALMHSMQNAVIEWARQIRDVVQQDSAQPLVDGKNPTPIVELKFWESREKNMFNIYSQLKCDKVRKMATVLKVIDSTYYSTVWNLFQEVIVQLRKAQDITAHLKPMTNVLDELESKDFAEHVESDCVTLKCVLEIVGLCWARCKSYQDPLRIVVLLQEICNLLIELARSYLDPENLLKGEIDESLEKLNNCKKVMKTYSDLYTETQNRMKDFFEEGDTPVEWTFARTLVFSRFDNFMKRIDQVRDFFETSLEYLKLEKIEFGGISGGALSQRVVTLFDEFNAEFKVFTERTYDPLDWNDQTGFKVDYYKFRSKIDDFDRRLAKCACLGFDDCCNVESMYKLLAIFGSLVKRPLIACDFDANYEIMLKTYKALEINLVKEKEIDSKKRSKKGTF